MTFNEFINASPWELYMFLLNKYKDFHAPYIRLLERINKYIIEQGYISDGIFKFKTEMRACILESNMLENVGMSYLDDRILEYIEEKGEEYFDR